MGTVGARENLGVTGRCMAEKPCDRVRSPGGQGLGKQSREGDEEVPPGCAQAGQSQESQLRAAA